jgi:hypothetical protein
MGHVRRVGVRMNEPTPIHDQLAAQMGVREDMRRTLYDDIAAAAAPDIVAGFEVLLIWAATAGDDS